MDQKESELVESLMRTLDAYQEEISTKDRIIQEQEKMIKTQGKYIDQLSEMLHQILNP